MNLQNSMLRVLKLMKPMSRVVCVKQPVRSYALVPSPSTLVRPMVIDDPLYQPFVDRHIVSRWEGYWLRMMKRKYELEGPPEKIPRSNLPNWNLEAEFKAFLCRLQINIQSDLLCAVFTEPVVNEDDESPTINNNSLVDLGRTILDSFVSSYIAHFLPKLPEDCHQSVRNHLTSDRILAHLSSHLGINDLIQAEEFPYTEKVLSRCFCATVAAVYCSSENGRLEAGKFIQDFVISQLIGHDIVNDIWKPLNPMNILVNECKKQNLDEPEVQLTKQSGITTVLPVYYVGIYIHKEMLVESGGETIPLAETDAAKLALKKLYNVSIEDFVVSLNLEPDLIKSLTPNLDISAIISEYTQPETVEENIEGQSQN